jgi:hypothetical protein
MKIRDRSMADVNSGEVTGRPDLTAGSSTPANAVIPCADHDAEIASFSDVPNPVSAVAAENDGGSVATQPNGIPEGYYKATKPVTARPNQKPVLANPGVTFHVGKSAALKTGPAVANPDYGFRNKRG